MPITRRISAPAPLATMSGMTPAMNAKEVIRIGRSLILAASRSEEHTSELQSHSDLHSFPTRRSSDLPHLRARSTRYNEWNDAGDERKRGHQNRTKSDPGGLECGGKSIASLALQIPRELDY